MTKEQINNVQRERIAETLASRLAIRIVKNPAEEPLLHEHLKQWAMKRLSHLSLDELLGRFTQTPMTTDERLERIEELLVALVKQRQVKDYYSINEVAKLLGKAAFTCREWARTGRIAAERKRGRGEFGEWRVSHQELMRIQNEGLLPDPRVTRKRSTNHTAATLPASGRFWSERNLLRRVAPNASSELAFPLRS